MSSSSPVIQRLSETFKESVRDATVFPDDPVVIAPPDRALEVLSFLKTDPALGFAMLVDLCGADYPDRGERFEIVYTLRSFTAGQHIRVRVPLPAEAPALPTATGLFRNADWYEREAYDMFGVAFEGHPNLRRILTHDEFVGHPLRKDYASTERHRCTRTIDLE